MSRTPVYEEHVSLGAKIVDFAGWDMPVQYEGILAEHEKVRTAAGLFDVSHMGEILVTGKGAAKAVNALLCNDVLAAKKGQAVYSPMCYDSGGVVDDIIVYRLNEETFFLVVNASNTDKDEKHIRERIGTAATVENVSRKYGQLALQGPLAVEILANVAECDLAAIRPFRFVNNVRVCGVNSLVSRTGYTGEDGFEVYLPWEETAKVWRELLKLGAAPIGLGARDTLRLEAALPLYGHELSQEISPLEAGLGRFVKLDGDDFAGKAALLKQKQEGPPRQRAGLIIKGRGVARQGATVRFEGAEVGVVTSGGPSPTLGVGIALALVKAGSLPIGAQAELVVRDKPIPAEVVPLPFYKKS